MKASRAGSLHALNECLLHSHFERHSCYPNVSAQFDMYTRRVWLVPFSLSARSLDLL